MQSATSCASNVSMPAEKIQSVTFNLPLIIIFLNTSGCSVTDVLLSAIISLPTAMVFMFGIIRASLKPVRNGIE